VRSPQEHWEAMPSGIPFIDLQDLYGVIGEEVVQDLELQHIVVSQDLGFNFDLSLLINLSIYLSIYRSIDQFIYLSINQSSYLFI
jgi:hypothetical protein